MRRIARTLLGLGIAAHLVCWLLPTYSVSTFGTSIMNGWEAFWATLTLPFDHFEAGNLPYHLTALTNFVMWPALILRWRRGAGRRRWGLALLACAALDSIWFVIPLLEHAGVRELLAGYYTWWASFAVVGAALLAEAPQRT